MDDVSRYLKCLWSDEFLRQNTQIPPLRFNSEAFNKTKDKKLKLGYLVFKTSTGETEFGLENLPISKASKRAMTMTIDKLREKGHELIPFEIPQQDILEMISCYIGFAKVASVPGMLDLQAKRHEYLLPQYKVLMTAATLPDFAKSFIAWFLSSFTNEQRLAHRLRALKSKNWAQVNQLHTRMDAWR